MSTQRLHRERQKILVVDDDYTLRELLAEYLAEAGFEVRTAQDGRAGLRAVEEYRFDLILTDYRMPVMTGLELATFVRRSDVVTPIILITGDSFTLDHEVVAQAGITQILSKPLKINELLDKCLLAAA